MHEIGRLSFATVLSSQSATALLKSMEDLPVLIVTGAEDQLVPLKSAQAMASGFANSVCSVSSIPSRPTPECLLILATGFVCRDWWPSQGAVTYPTRSARRRCLRRSPRSSAGWLRLRPIIFPRPFKKSPSRPRAKWT